MYKISRNWGIYPGIWIIPGLNIFICCLIYIVAVLEQKPKIKSKSIAWFMGQHWEEGKK